MLQINDTIISLDVIDKNFACDLSKCKGICCVEGEEGAPVTEDEVSQIEALLPDIWEDLSHTAQEVISQQGVAYFDRDNELAIPIVNGAECVFAFQDDHGYWKCRIEQAFEQQKTSFRKPISCHLYPVRLQKHKTFVAVNYHQWHVCRDAVVSGNDQSKPLYQFLKEPLIRRFGEEWFQQLTIAADHFAKTKQTD
jgi:hypothetical protein